jgi:peptide deformylase
MAIRKIFMDGEPILLKRSRQVTNFDDRLAVLLGDLRDTMHKADGLGLAAPQVGILRRIAVVEVDDIYLELINPQIVTSEGEQIGAEGCLSVDSDKNCDVARPMKITVKAYDRYGKLYEKTLEGLSARAVCHELDHLDGILFYTREYKEK